MRKNIFYSILRYIAAFILMFYGWAKLNGAQFTILDSELDKPMREVSGFWLTWYYFGYSWFYGNVIGLTQVVGAIMLLFRKTTLIATCLLLAVVANIILIDFCYGIDLGALIVALFLGLCLISIASFHKDELIDLFWGKQNDVSSPERKRRSILFAKIITRSFIIILPVILTYFIANYNNRKPTPIDGRWKVERSEPVVSLGQNPLNYVYFERNRAYMCVFKFGAGTWMTHHFEVDEQTGKLEIWQYWLRKGERIFTGRYQLDDGKLTLTGAFAGSDTGSVVELRKQP